MHLNISCAIDIRIITLEYFSTFFKEIGELSTLYEFSCPSSGCEWKTLDQKLQVPRAKHVAFLIDSSFFNCKQNNSTMKRNNTEIQV